MLCQPQAFRRPVGPICLTSSSMCEDVWHAVFCPVAHDPRHVLCTVQLCMSLGKFCALEPTCGFGERGLLCHAALRARRS